MCSRSNGTQSFLIKTCAIVARGKVVCQIIQTLIQVWVDIIIGCFDLTMGAVSNYLSGDLVVRWSELDNNLLGESGKGIL